MDPSGEQVGLFQMGPNVAVSLTNFVLAENAKNLVAQEPELEVQLTQPQPEVQQTQPEVPLTQPEVQLTQFTSWTQTAA